MAVKTKSGFIKRFHSVTTYIHNVLVSGRGTQTTQDYYWSKEWQDEEKQTRADIEAGRTTELDGIDEIRQHFSLLVEKPDNEPA